MKKATLALVFLMGAPLLAQKWEVGLFVGQQSYKSISESGMTFEPEKKTVASVRFGYSVVDVGPALFQLTAGYQPQANTSGQVNGTSIPDFSYDHKHWSFGAMFNFKAVVAFGAGIEYRFERLNKTYSGMSDATFNRPWARANVGLAFPTPVMKPFVGLEVAVPLVNKSADASSSMEDQIRSLAPKYQIGLYGGIRF